MDRLKQSVLQHYWFTILLTLVVFGFVGVFSGPGALWSVFILALIEITFSFDNAVLNSEVLGRMAKIWRVIFLTVGIAIAVFGVRLILPLFMVSATSGDSIGSVLHMALQAPEEYEHHLLEAYPLIAAFGGTFLLMIGLHFLAEERKHKWFVRIEDPIARFGHPWIVSIGGAILGIVALGTLLRPGELRLCVAAALGAITFVLIRGASSAMESNKTLGSKKASGWMNFLYLEILDASFSFDGVVAAFAITKDVLLIAAGLGIGALFVRSITVHLLERDTLSNYRYLVHGAHYAIVTLGIILLVGTRFELPDVVTGLIGISIISLSFYHSVRANRRARG